MPETEKVVTQKRKPIKMLFKSFVDVKRWSSYDEVSANTKNTLSLFRRLLSRGTNETRHETYEEAIVRLGLNETQVVTRKNNFLYSFNQLVNQMGEGFLCGHDDFHFNNFQRQKAFDCRG